MFAAATHENRGVIDDGAKCGVVCRIIIALMPPGRLAIAGGGGGELWGAAVDGGIEYRSKKDRKVERELRNHGQKFGREAGRSGDICP